VKQREQGRSMPFTIETTSLTKAFGSFTAVKGIDVRVEAGEIFGFLGPNGAGKTTAIRMLCGLLAPTSGSGRVAGFDIMKQTAKIRSRIGYMSQKFSLYADLSVADNLKLFGALYGLSGARLAGRIDEMVELLDMRALMKRMTGALPWGWQQRLSLACSNLHEPEILFLDEPTGSVDPLSRKNFWAIIAMLSAKGTTVFVTTHHMDEAEYCARVSLMVDGAIAEQGSPREMKERFGCETLHDVFIKVSKARMHEAAAAKGTT
jgi:ABC-2 type transport system ATP-binding protein